MRGAHCRQVGGGRKPKDPHLHRLTPQREMARPITPTLRLRMLPHRRDATLDGSDCFDEDIAASEAARPYIAGFHRYINRNNEEHDGLGPRRGEV